MVTGTISFVNLSVRKEHGSHWTNFHEINSWVFFENLSRKFKFNLNLTRITGASPEDLCTFMISRSILIRMRKFSVKNRRRKQNIFFSIPFFQHSRCLWDNMEKYGRTSQATDDNMIQRTSTACWILKATYMHSEFVKLIAFPRQGWLLYMIVFLFIYDCVLKTYSFRPQISNLAGFMTCVQILMQVFT